MVGQDSRQKVYFRQVQGGPHTVVQVQPVAVWFPRYCANIPRVKAGREAPSTLLPTCGKSAGLNCVKLSKVALLSSTWHGLHWNVMPLVFSKGSFLQGCKHRSAATVYTQPGSKSTSTFKAAFLTLRLSKISSSRRKFPSLLSDLALCSCHQIRARLPAAQ